MMRQLADFARMVDPAASHDLSSVAGSLGYIHEGGVSHGLNAVDDEFFGDVKPNCHALL